jgi:hypothetical protein
MRWQKPMRLIAKRIAHIFLYTDKFLGRKALSCEYPQQRWFQAPACICLTAEYPLLPIWPVWIQQPYSLDEVVEASNLNLLPHLLPYFVAAWSMTQRSTAIRRLGSPFTSPYLLQFVFHERHRSQFLM